MPALGQKRTHTLQQQGSLFDQPVGADKQRGWYGQAKLPGGFEIGDQLQFGKSAMDGCGFACSPQENLSLTFSLFSLLRPLWANSGHRHGASVAYRVVPRPSIGTACVDRSRA
jgi:hypothetical protein